MSLLRLPVPPLQQRPQRITENNMACSVPQTPCRAVVRQFDVEPALRRHFTPHGEVNSSLPYAQGIFLDKVENSSLSRGVRGVPQRCAERLSLSSFGQKGERIRL